MDESATGAEGDMPFSGGLPSGHLNNESRARSVGHEINNLLVPIITLAALIEDSAPDDQTRLDARTIQESARRIANLLDGLTEDMVAATPRASRKGTP